MIDRFTYMKHVYFVNTWIKVNPAIITKFSKIIYRIVKTISRIPNEEPCFDPTQFMKILCAQFWKMTMHLFTSVWGTAGALVCTNENSYWFNKNKNMLAVFLPNVQLLVKSTRAKWAPPPPLLHIWRIKSIYSKDIQTPLCTVLHQLGLALRFDKH